jgi:hypothetical protein
VTEDRGVIKLYALMSVISFALLVYCVIDIIGTPAHRVRNLPKVGWLILVLLFPLVGSIAWFAAGRPEKSARAPRAHERELPQYPEYNRPGRAAAADPVKDEEFLRQVRERAEEQRKRYEASRKQEPPAEPEE